MIPHKIKILIFGHGFIGSRCQEFFSKQALTITGIDISNLNAVKKIFDQYEPSIIINTVGYIGKRNIKECETQKYQTFLANTLGPQILVNECAQRNIFMIHLSTTYIFNGTKIFTETDIPNFLTSYYSQTKILAETVLTQFDNVAIFRINKPIDDRPYLPNLNRNKIDKIASYRKVFHDQTNITYIPHLLSVINFFFKKYDKTKSNQELRGIWHVMCDGAISNIDLATAYTKYIDPNHHYEIVSMTAEQKLNIPVCIVSTQKLKLLMGSVPNAKSTLTKCLTDYKKHLKISPKN